MADVDDTLTDDLDTAATESEEPDVVATDDDEEELQAEDDTEDEDSEPATGEEWPGEAQEAGN